MAPGRKKKDLPEQTDNLTRVIEIGLRRKNDRRASATVSSTAPKNLFPKREGARLRSKEGEEKGDCVKRRIEDSYAHEGAVESHIIGDLGFEARRPSRKRVGGQSVRKVRRKRVMEYRSGTHQKSITRQKSVSTGTGWVIEPKKN